MERLGFDYYGTTTEVCDTSYLIVVLGGMVCYNYNRDQTVDDYFSLLWSHLIESQTQIKTRAMRSFDF